MNVVDAVVCGAVVVAAFRGWRLGLIREVFGFAGWVAGFLLAIRGMFAFVAPISEATRVAPAFVGLGLFVGIFCLVYVGSRLIGWLLTKAVHATPLGSVDVVFGLALGAVEGLALMAGILYLLQTSKLVPSALPKIETSVLAAPLIEGAGRAVAIARDVEIVPEDAPKADAAEGDEGAEAPEPR